MIEGWVESPFMRVSCHVLCLLKCWVTQITKKREERVMAYFIEHTVEFLEKIGDAALVTFLLEWRRKYHRQE